MEIYGYMIQVDKIGYKKKDGNEIENVMEIKKTVIKIKGNVMEMDKW